MWPDDDNDMLRSKGVLYASVNSMKTVKLILIIDKSCINTN